MKKIWTAMIMVVLAALCGCGMQSQPAESMPPSQEVSVGFSFAEETGDLAIPAGDVTLRYPGLWKDRLTVLQGENSVVFFATIDNHGPERLFEIAFGRDSNVVGAIGETTVSVISDEPSFDDSWSEGEISAFHAMQEDVNYIFEQLTADYGFVFN